MIIEKIETFRIEAVPNILWVQLTSDDGVTGLGESYFDPGSTEAHIHEHIGPYLLGRSALDIRKHYRKLIGYLGQQGSGVEQRARGMVDSALWDILGKSSGLPLYQLLGGAVRDDIVVYNTCAGNSYNIRPDAKNASFDHGTFESDDNFEDTTAFLTDPVGLAESLLAMGIGGMKIWPFDFLPEAEHGGNLSRDSLKTGLEPFEKIRAALGDKIDLMAELHGLWSVPAARQIARALEPLDLTWIEDPLGNQHIHGLSEVQSASSLPIAIGETHSLESMLPAVVQKSLDYLVADVAWGGGVTNALSAAEQARAHGLSVLFHDCTGPVVLGISTHLAMAHEHCPTQEIARAYFFGWYNDFADGLPEFRNGRLRRSDRPGHGVTLRAEMMNARGTTRRQSALR